MLAINHLDAFYGKIQVLWDVSLNINEGEIVALVGANGAGKTTLLNNIMGLHPPASGTITFRDQSLLGLAPHKIGELGIAYVPEGGKPFAEMSIRENLEMGAYVRQSWQQKEETIHQVYDTFPILKERQKQLARTLSGGERQMLAVGRALMSKPKLCLFDEPSIGLAPLIVTELFRVIQQLRAHDITVLLIEQNVRRSLEIADRAYVLENGQIVLEGDSQEILQEDLTRKAYLGL